jgi:magnesium transporter
MINAYSVSDGLLQKLDCSNDTAGLAEATWIDLLEPTKEEEEAVEAFLHVDIPDHATRMLDSGRRYRTDLQWCETRRRRQRASGTPIL